MCENSIVGEQPPLKTTDGNVIIFREVVAERVAAATSDVTLSR